MEYWPSPNDGPLRQGEILEGLVEYQVSGSGSDDIKRIKHRRCVIMSADCDLEQDYNRRLEGPEVDDPKLVPYALGLDMFEDNEIRPMVGTSSVWRLVRQGQHQRYHHFAEGQQGPARLPALTADFKRFTAFFLEEVYRELSRGGAARVCRVPPVYVHDFVQRFFAYLSRIGLPAEADLPRLFPEG